MNNKINCYESPGFFEESNYGAIDILLELMIPLYYLCSGYHWDRAVARHNGISHRQVFLSNLSDYLSLEFFKTCVLSAGIASYYLLR